LKPGLLVVEINVLPDGLTDLPSAAHHMHKKMRDGQCDLHYKHHILRPRAESLKAEHVYDQVAEIGKGIMPHLCFYNHFIIQPH
jgi:hypothetical protein